ncbi:MAG TPA: NAD(P)/FAD-dependent oxidoreductase [Bacteroidales bacterium]
MNYDVIVIGAGLGGLTAGARLARNGKKVLVVEQHNIPGGCATTFKRKDIIVEVGLHEMDGLDDFDSKKDIFEGLGIFKNVEFIRLPEFYRYKNPNIDFVMPDDADEAKAKLIDKFPDEEKGIHNYFKQIRGIRKEIPKLPRAWFWRFVKLPFFPLLYPHVVRNAKKTIGSFLDENIQNEDLKLLLTANLSYYGDDPYTLSMLYFATAQDGYYAGGWYIKGGSQKLSDYLASCITNNGGEVLYRHLVEEILVKGNKAIGIVYRKKSKEETERITAKAKNIIANNAVPTLAKMLPQAQSLVLSEKIKSLEHSCSIITLYLGFNKTPKSMGNKCYSTFLANDDVKTLPDFARDLKHAAWEKRHMIFVDYSQVDAGLAPEGKALGVMASTDYAKDWENLSKEDYKKKKEEVCQVFIGRLEKLIPGIKEHIEFYELGTAKTIERYTLNPAGAIYGFAQTLPQAGYNRFGQTMPIKNLHVASAWGFPGGGFTGAIISGFLTSLKIK